jgi:ceramide glucosyltransferase
MIHLFLYFSVTGLVSSTIYLILVLKAAGRFRQDFPNQIDDGRSLPVVAVLKPLHGLEPHLERNLESFFVQDYPEFQLFFGVRDSSDPALKVVELLQRKHPHIKSTIVLSGEPEYPNAKVFTLEKMLACAPSSYLVITDSDVCVNKNCLREVVTPLLESQNGVVTCLYRGLTAGGFWSRLEALGMSVELTSGVLVANMVEGMRFALGPVMATRRDVLDLIGGISALGSYCADDYVLGNRAHAGGKRVVLSKHIVGHVAMNTSARRSLEHQVRWMRSTRFSRSAGHIGTGLTYAMPFGLLGLAISGLAHHWQLGVALLAWAFLNRVIQAIVIGWGVIEDPQSLSLSWLYPIRDLTGFLVWCASFFGREIVWRHERYRLATDGRMVRIL